MYPPVQEIRSRKASAREAEDRQNVDLKLHDADCVPQNLEHRTESSEVPCRIRLLAVALLRPVLLYLGNVPRAKQKNERGIPVLSQGVPDSSGIPPAPKQSEILFNPFNTFKVLKA